VQYFISDCAGTFTWYEFSPVETTVDNTLIRTSSTQSLQGPTNVTLNWNLSVAADININPPACGGGTEIIQTSACSNSVRLHLWPRINTVVLERRFLRFYLGRSRCYVIPFFFFFYLGKTL